MENNSPSVCPVSQEPLSESPHVVIDERQGEWGIYCIGDLLGTIKGIRDRINSGSLSYNVGNVQKAYFYPNSLEDFDKIISEQWENTGLRAWMNAEFTLEEKGKIANFIASNHKEGDEVIVYYFQTSKPVERVLYATNSPTPLVDPHNTFMNKFGKPAGLSGVFPNSSMPYPIRKVPSKHTQRRWRGGKKRATRRKHLRKRSSTHKRRA